VKTAISIPDEMFIRADAFARRLGLSRSELYTRALDAYLGPATDDAITAALDQVYGDEVSELDPVVRRAQIRAVGDTW
jgi:metal-responsive CopG/Arc/MetJ family transcriptional regulator